jgi:hypothetical protein
MMIEEVTMTKNADLSKSSKKPVEHNKPAGLLPGQPGYRTRDGRSGYDPIDMRTEAAHTAGTVLYKLFRGRMRNPLALLLLGVLGLALIAPLILAISGLANGSQLPWDAWMVLLITGLVGIVVLVNFIRNLIKIINQ